MTVIPPPSAEAQLAFLAKLQRLFAEGDFTATYKFALLIALADIAVEIGSDDGGELGFRQFSLRGLEKVRAEFKLVCLALNLRRMSGLMAR